MANAQQGTKRAGATVLTPIEEHAEGFFKWMMDSGKKTEAWFIQQIREVEANTKAGQTMAANLMDLSPELRRQEVIEALSRLAVANATGKVQDSQLSAGIKAIFRALKETFKAILELAADITAFRQSGKMDSEFAYWLDVAGGMSEDYYGENMVRQMEADMIAESMDGMPEIKSAIAGKLPHPETLKATGHPLAGEVAALYDEIKNSEESGANQSARTRKANEFFLPPGEMVDLDKVRESLNQQGFDFQTPADMLDAAMLSVGYRKPQYAIASTGMESFSIGRIETPEKLGEILLDKIGPEGLAVEQPKAKYEDKRQLLLDFSKAVFPGSQDQQKDAAGNRQESIDGADQSGRWMGLRILRQKHAAQIAENLKVDFLGATIGTPEELALHAQSLRNPKFETFYLLAAQYRTKRHKGGAGLKIVDAMAVTSRVPCSASVFEGKKGWDEGIASHVEFLKNAKADAYFLLHNHPSGDPGPSTEDLSITRRHADALKAEGIDFIDHLVINHSTFSQIASDGTVQTGAIPRSDLKETSDPYGWPSKLIDKVADIGQMMDRLEHLIEVAKQIESDRTAPDSVFGFVLNARLRVVASMAGSVEDFKKITPEQAADYAREQGGVRFMLHANAENDARARAMIARLKPLNGDLVLTEMVVSLPDGTYVSAQETGIFGMPPAFFGLDKDGHGVRVQESFSIARVTPAMDREYLAAVEAGDMETAQRMVDEQMARKEYAPGVSGKLAHTAPSAEAASDDGSSGVVSLANLKNSDLVPADYWTRPDWYLSTATELESHQKIRRAMDGQKIRVYRTIPKTAKDTKIRNGDWVTPSREYAIESGYDEKAPVKVISTLARPEHLFWDGNSADELGFDDGRSYAYRNTKNNRKLTDPVTYEYDEDGNASVIPLSKRFDFKHPSTSFSIARADRPFFSASNVSDLRHDKTAWLDAGASPAGADEIVAKYYKTAAFAGIPKDAVLVAMPSSSGRNRLPQALADRLSKDFGNPIEKRAVGTAIAAGEAKNKRTFFDKEADPVGFVPVPEVLADLQGKRVFIAEDVHNTGESWIAFARMLQENGVEVVGVAALVSTEQRMTSPRDIERLSEKVAAHLGKEVDEVKPAMHSLFDGTFKQLFNKAEADITRSGANAGKLFDIASSGRRAGAYSNPLRSGREVNQGVLGDQGLNLFGESWSIARADSPLIQPLFSPPAVRSPALSTAFTGKAIS